MKNFNKELYKDITRLKALHAKKDKTDFKRAKCEVMLKHNISKATVYREMKKDVPGFYKTPSYSPPVRAITEREIQMVRELLYKKIPVMDIPRIMEAETGETYNWDRIDKLRTIIDARIKEDEGKPLNTEFESSFGGELKRVVEEALKIDRMAPNAYIEIEVYGRRHRLSFSEAKDIALICMNSYERTKEGYAEGTTYVREKIWHLFEQKVSSVQSGATLTAKELIELKNAHDNLMKDFDEWLTNNFAVIYFTAMELTREKATFSEIFNLAQKYSRLFPECAPEKCECWCELEEIQKKRESAA